MKGSEILKLLGLLVVILFSVLYFGQATGYYKVAAGRKNTLTDDAIKRFEEDVAAGKEIVASNYLEKEKDYNNNISKIGREISKLIEMGFEKFMEGLFRELEQIMNN